MASPSQQTPILIIGGGLAGLSLACLLAKHNTQCIVLEKHLQSSPHPRAVGFTTRTMEIFSEIGIVEQIPQTTSDFRLRRIQVESLAGKWGEEMGKNASHGHAPMATYSSFSGAAIAQDKLEPLLRERAVELSCDVRMGHRMLGFSAPRTDDDEIVVTVRDPAGVEYTISARYLVAADGHRSTIRQNLQIETSGRGHLQTLTSVLFHAPALDKYLEAGFHQFQIRQQSGLAGFMTTYNDSRWVLMFQDNKQRDHEELGQAILQATGISDLQYEIIATGEWDLQARIAETFVYPKAGDGPPRICLAGDAAHTLPPTRGGYGANTGIADAHNLAWKLASVVHGKSKPELLRSYDAERRAVAWVRHNQTFAGPDYARYGRDGDDYGEWRDPVAVELGQVYESDVIVGGETTSQTVPITLKPDELKGRPGSRAPYVPLVTSDGQKSSSLRFFGKGWVVAAGDKEWQKVSSDISKKLDIAVSTIIVPSAELKEENAGDFSKAFGVGEHGASLIRPDGYVAWLTSSWSGSDKAGEELADALKKAACINAS